jgi:hypothetical protein
MHYSELRNYEFVSGSGLSKIPRNRRKKFQYFIIFDDLMLNLSDNVFFNYHKMSRQDPIINWPPRSRSVTVRFTGIPDPKEIFMGPQHCGILIQIRAHTTKTTTVENEEY